MDTASRTGRASSFTLDHKSLRQGAARLLTRLTSSAHGIFNCAVENKLNPAEDIGGVATG